MSDVLEEIGNDYAIKIRQLAAGEAANGTGLLVVSGHDYAARVVGKHHLLCCGGESIMETPVDLLIVFDNGNAELDKLDRHYRDIRSVYLVDLLQTFNNKPYEERLSVTDEFRKQQATGEAFKEGESWFGIESHYLRLVYIEEQTRQVIPTEL